MKRFLTAVSLGMLVSLSVGCFFPAYSTDPARRTRQLIYSSENMRYFQDEWERFWLLDMPDHSTPHRVHGGIL